MDKVRFVVLYGGEWIKSGEKFKYQYKVSKIISVSRETSYESLHDIVSRLVEANPNKSSIKMKFIFNSPEVLAPFEVVNDDDVQVFLCENSDVNTRTSLCVTVERKRRIIPNTQDPDNELVNEDIANVFESDNGNGVGLDNIHESLLNPNDFQNVDAFSIGVDNDDEVGDSRPSTSEVPSRRSRVASSQGIGIKSSTIHGSYTSLESIVNNVKEVGVGDLFPSKEELHMKMQLLSIGNHFQFKVKKSTKTLLVMSCIVKDCKWHVRATKLKDYESFRIRKYSPDHTCSLDALHFDHRQASSKLIGHCIKSKFEGTSQCYRPNDIIDDMKKHYGMTLGYNKALRAREVALGLARGGWMARDVGYVVFKGHSPGVYESWNECETQINGFEGQTSSVSRLQPLSVALKSRRCRLQGESHRRRRRLLQGESRRRRRLQGECAVVVFKVTSVSHTVVVFKVSRTVVF
ncbi:hypothetical protein LWI29_004484 [Acer saccharum]|uniref:Transposase MuDR plant domain-containing protein n=1 Tax=Acer saccharum TaxID=4024 RepID=A0AA39TBN4_ACESA|nr:hypothetical protein LWI29_004484 [Acer saccharum]